jgi:uncharacterized delta-60 repeat protein
VSPAKRGGGRVRARWRVASGVAGIVACAALTAAGGAAAAPGDLDFTFGANGRVTASPGGGPDVARAVAVQRDGKIVIAGEDGDGARLRFAVARYNADGTPDQTFGRGGVVTIDLGSTAGSYAATALALYPDGRIIVAGQAANSDFGLVRHQPNGALDTSFGGDGIVTADFGGVDVGRGLALFRNGDIAVAGYSDQNFAVARFNSDGSPDTGFDGDGKQTTSFDGRRSFGLAVAIDSAGRALVSGLASNGKDFDAALARYGANGALDSSLDGDGRLTVAYGDGFDSAHDLAIQPDGRILLGGQSSDNGFGLARVDPSGALDPSFDGDGRTVTSFGAGPASARGLTLTSTGAIIAAGDQNRESFAVARYNSAGSPDPSFNGDGRLTIDFGSYDAGRAVALMPDGRIVVAGVASPGADFDFGIARLLADGPPPRCAGRNPTIIAPAGRLGGTPRRDVIVAPGRVANRIFAGAGSDVICAGAGRDVVQAAKGKDLVIGAAGADTLRGGPGNDKLRGGPGRDRFSAGRGTDRCLGQTGRDRALGCERAPGVP